MMAELMAKEEDIITADLASIPPELDGPKLVKDHEPETLTRAFAVSEPMPLFTESEMGDFRSQWSKVLEQLADPWCCQVLEWLADPWLCQALEQLADLWLPAHLLPPHYRAAT
jgi:hypothetical protein